MDVPYAGVLFVDAFLFGLWDRSLTMLQNKVGDCMSSFRPLADNYGPLGES